MTIVARDGDDGVLVVNVWETDEGRRAMAAEPEVQEALATAGLPTPQFERYDVVAIRGSERLGGHMEAMA